jgi:hypothetical protein
MARPRLQVLASLSSSSEDDFQDYVTNDMTNEGEVEVYSDLNLLTVANNEIGACGFEPQTPTVSR